jgi:hypothetical protein
MGEPQATRELTFGEKAVGITFNPSGDKVVHKVVHETKYYFAKTIDQVHAIREQSDDPEVKRMCSVSITELQTAQMWAVKAATWQS